MDQDLRKEIEEFVFRTLFYEIAKDGRVDDNEKQILSRVMKLLRLSPQTVQRIRKEEMQKITRVPSVEPMNLKNYFLLLRDFLSKRVDEDFGVTFLSRLARVLGIKPDSVEKMMDFLYPGKREEKSKKLSSKSSQFWRKSTLDQMALVSAENSEEYDRVLRMRAEGRYLQAISRLLDYTIPMGYESRYFLLARMHLEINKPVLAMEWLEKARKAGMDEGIYLEEQFFIEYTLLKPQDAVARWERFLAWDGGGKLSVDKNEALLLLARGLQERTFSFEALKFLKQKDDPDFIRCRGEIHSRIFTDLYFLYYGFGITSFQLFASLVVLGVCFYNFDHILPAFVNLLKQTISGFSDSNLVWVSFQKVLPFFFLVIALLPVSVINFRMILAGVQRKTHSYTEVMGKWIRIVNFGQEFHLCASDEKKPLWIYQDDNDYTYISLIRHLPFVPNFTYIYGFDMIRGVFVLLPLFGVADGKLFQKKFLSGKGFCSVYPLNMIGVRFAQSGSLISLFFNSWVAVFLSLALALAFFMANVTWIQMANIQAYALFLFGYILFLILIFYWPGIVTSILGIRFLSWPFGVNIIKNGIVLLAAASLIKHYHVYGFSSVIPVICLSAVFYLLFAKTKYPADKKQIVAEVCALKETHANVSDLKFLEFRSDKEKKGLVLYYNGENLALDRKLFGWTLYYDVITRTPQFCIGLTQTDTGCVMRVSTYNYFLNMDLELVKNLLENSGFKVEVTSVIRQSRSRIPMFSLSVWMLIFFSWQIWYMFLPPPLLFSKKIEVEPNQVLEFLEKSEEGFSHKKDPVLYDGYVSSGKIIFQRSRGLDWEEFEQGVRLGLELPSLPPFIRQDGFRDGIVSFFTWNLWTKRKKLDAITDAQSILHFCNALGANVSPQDPEKCIYELEIAKIYKWVSERRIFPALFLPFSKEIFELYPDLVKLSGEKILEDPAHARLAVLQDPQIFFSLSAGLQSRIEILKALLSSSPEWIKKIDKKFLENKELMLWFLSVHPDYFTVLSSEMRKDNDLYFEALSHSQEALTFFMPEFHVEKRILRRVLSIDGLLLAKIPKEYRNDEELIRIAVNANGDALSFAPEEFLKKKEFVSLALKTAKNPSSWVDLSFFEDRDMSLRLLEVNGELFKFLPEKFKNDKELILKAIHSEPFSVRWMDSFVFSDLQISQELLKQNPDEFANLSDLLRADPLSAELAIRGNGVSIRYADEKIRSNQSFARMAVEKNPKSFLYLPAGLQKELQIFKTAIQNDPELLLDFSYSHSMLKHHQKKISGFLWQAVCLENGIYFPQSYQKALDFYIQAQGGLEKFSSFFLGNYWYQGLAEGRPDYDRAWKIWKDGEKREDARALHAIGKMHLFGHGVFRSISEARTWFEKSAAREFLPAMVDLGDISLQEGKIQTARFWYRKASMMGSSQAHESLAILEKNQDSSQDLWKYHLNRSSQDLPKSAFLLGLLEENNQKRQAHFLKASELGYLPAQCFSCLGSEASCTIPSSFTQNLDFSKPGQFLASLSVSDPRLDCLRGIQAEMGFDGMPVNQEKAVSFYVRSQKIFFSSHRLGMILSSADKWFESAGKISAEELLLYSANLGFAPSQYQYALILKEKGDKKKAVSYLEKALSFGYVQAGIVLGELLLEDENKIQDGLLILEKIFEKGETRAALILGNHYLKTKKQESAREWFLKGEEFGDSEAIKALDFLEASSREMKK